MGNTLVAINDIRSGIEAGKNARSTQGKALYDNTNLVRALALYKLLNVTTTQGITGTIGSEGQEYGTLTNMSALGNVGTGAIGTIGEDLKTCFFSNSLIFKKITIKKLYMQLGDYGIRTIINTDTVLYLDGAFQAIAKYGGVGETVEFVDKTTYYKIRYYHKTAVSDNFEIRFYYDSNRQITDIQMWGYGGSSTNERRYASFELEIEGAFKNIDLSLQNLEDFLALLEAGKEAYTNLSNFLE